MIDISKNCPLCVGPIKYFGRNSLATKYPDKPIEVKETECPRCGPLRYTDQALSEFNLLRDLGPDKVLPFAALARERKDLGLAPAIFVSDRYERADALPEIYTVTATRLAFPPTVDATFERALLVLARRGPSPGSVVTVDATVDAPLLGAFDERGSMYLLEELEGQRLIEKRAHGSFRLTRLGWQRVEEIRKSRKNLRSTSAFIGMSYRAAANNERELALRTAVSSVGYDPLVVRGEAFTGDIVARIKADIRSSRFVVADLTDQNENVYYEAGFADGLGLPVLYTCVEAEVNEAREGFKRVGFNLAHEKMIPYATLEELTPKLAVWIKGLVGPAGAEGSGERA